MCCRRVVSWMRHCGFVAHEELPVFGRLGDVREAAVTRAKIADVLQARGELDEALRVYREEVLPGVRAAGRRALGCGDVGEDRGRAAGAW